MAKTSVLGDKTTMFCTFIVKFIHVVMFGLGSGFMRLFFHEEGYVRVMIMVINT